MSFRIGLITDTHLSKDRPYFNSNFQVIGEELRRMKPDLVLNMGDLTLDGAESADDLLLARELHDQLSIPWLAIPGNHDVGDNHDSKKSQLITEERRQQWLSLFGADYWHRDIPGWRILAINSLLLGSDLPSAAEQEAFIADAASSCANKQLALFLHKPLFCDTTDDTEVSHHGVNPEPRARLLSLLGGQLPRLVCSGHRHEYRERLSAASSQIWAPAGSFTLAEWFMPARGGIHTVGFVDLSLHPDGTFEGKLACPSGIQLHDLADFPGAYGDLRERVKAHAH